MKDKILYGLIGFLLATTIFCAIGWSEARNDGDEMAKDIKAIRKALCPPEKTDSYNLNAETQKTLYQQIESMQKTTEKTYKTFIENPVYLSDMISHGSLLYNIGQIKERIYGGL